MKTEIRHWQYITDIQHVQTGTLLRDIQSPELPPFSPCTTFGCDPIQKISAGISLIDSPRKEESWLSRSKFYFWTLCSLRDSNTVASYLYNSSFDRSCHHRIVLKSRHTFYPCPFYISAYPRVPIPPWKHVSKAKKWWLQSWVPL